MKTFLSLSILFFVAGKVLVFAEEPQEPAAPVVLTDGAATIAEKEFLQELRVATYNVENLYDAEVNQPINPATEKPGDSEFSAQSWRRWTPERYQTKVERLAWVLGQMKPHICFVQEVENRRVLEDLTNTLLQKTGWDLRHIAHVDSNDPRGIDVAILSQFPIRSLSYRPLKGRRGQLVAELDVDGTCVIAVANHWKSQIGDMQENIKIRTTEAARLREEFIKHLRVDPNAVVIAGGDYNEDFDGPAVCGGLNPAFSREESLQSLSAPVEKILPYNLISDIPSEKRGSFFFARTKRWNTFDGLFITPAMLRPLDQPGPEWRAENPTNTVTFRLPEMEFSDDKRPNSYRRVRAKGQLERYYTSGYSDHFPILTIFHRYKSEETNAVAAVDESASAPASEAVEKPAEGGEEEVDKAGTLAPETVEKPAEGGEEEVDKAGTILACRKIP
ncbi:MAG: endonuclease/exonuclease/phosphatase family protein [Kiritimatiellia bacterium]